MKGAEYEMEQQAAVRLSAEGVHKWYPGGVHAVRDMTLAAEPGELMVFVGPSGCGKSTLLRMIAGLERVDGGVIRMGERVINRAPPKDRDIAMVFQNYALYPTMKVYDNIAFPLKMRRWKRPDIRERVAQVAERLDLTGLLDRRPGALSGGQRQRVALARAMVRSPRLFLMDEPLSNLDAKLRVKMRRAITALQRDLGTTTVYVTHDQTEAMTMGDRVAVMKDGVLQQADTPQRVYRRPANLFVAQFIGSPPMNLWAGEALPGGLCPPGQVLGLRPEHVVPGGDGPAVLQARIEGIECTGRESVVYLSAEGGLPITMTTDAAFPGRSGEHLPVSLQIGRACRFDRESGLLLPEPQAVDPSSV